MVLALGVAGQLVAIEVHVAEIAGAVAHGLTVEVRRRWIAVLAAGGDRFRADAIAEFHDGHEAVPAGAVHFLRAAVGARAERGQGSPARRREGDRYARRGVVERLHDVTGEALEPVDVAPGRVPPAEI